MRLTEAKGLLRAGLCALAIAGAVATGDPAIAQSSQQPAAATPSKAELLRDADTLLAAVAEQTRVIRPLSDRISGNKSTLELIDKTLLPAVRQAHNDAKAEAETFDREWTRSFAEPCGRDFRDKDEYRRWLARCKSQLARENEIGSRVADKAAAYNQMVDERDKLVQQNRTLAQQLRTQQAALDGLLLKLVSNPLILRCERCVANITTTLTVAECYLTCWRTPG